MRVSRNRPTLLVYISSKTAKLSISNSYNLSQPFDKSHYLKSKVIKRNRRQVLLMH